VKLEDAPSASASDASVRLFVEQHGQDAATTGNNGVSLIQFKYSQNARPIMPAALAEILLALEESSKNVQQKAMTRCRAGTSCSFRSTNAVVSHDGNVPIAVET
jgi:hypothetical protein